LSSGFSGFFQKNNNIFQGPHACWQPPDIHLHFASASGTIIARGTGKARGPGPFRERPGAKKEKAEADIGIFAQAHQGANVKV